MAGLELWGGPECTVNRIGGRYTDQNRASGHHDRLADLDHFAELGIAAIRYPVLWERVAPDHPDQLDWRWSDERLGRLRCLGIRPIAGLVHHGSGPAYTDLLDEGFATGLGDYAGKVAERYPWLEEWTPVNEPLTTARFSTLYGHWYPHLRDEAAFWRALLNQIDGTRAAMRAVRRVNPAARLIQTEDLGRTYATARLADQAGFDNVRRWAGWDLLFGRVTPHHPLWQRLESYGLGERLRAIADDPCPPDVVGVNHYLTSDRLLDHRLQRYPPHVHGDNGRVPYADVEAIRVLDPPPAGLAGALHEAWQRYAAPIAITELHNGSTREEQLRWAAEGWDTSATLRGQGIDVRAVTAWSLLGSHGWDTLLTKPGRYEPGVFDTSGGAPRATALAALWRGITTNAPRHPVAMEPGWWRRADRLVHAPLPRCARAVTSHVPSTGQPLLIRIDDSALDRAVERACIARGLHHVVVRSGLENPACDSLDRPRPWGVIDLLSDPAEASELARACRVRGISYLDLTAIHDGDDGSPTPFAAPPGGEADVHRLVAVALDRLIDQDVRASEVGLCPKADATDRSLTLAPPARLVPPMEAQPATPQPELA